MSPKCQPKAKWSSSDGSGAAEVPCLSTRLGLQESGSSRLEVDEVTEKLVIEAAFVQNTCATCGNRVAVCRNMSSGGTGRKVPQFLNPLSS